MVAGVLRLVLIDQQDGECKGVAHAGAWRKVRAEYVRWRTLGNVRRRTDLRRPAAYKAGMGNGTWVRQADLVVVCIRPAKICVLAQSRVMLARARTTGVFELLTAEAWARALGYRPAELNGASLRALMRLEDPAAKDVVPELLGESQRQPLEVTLRCKDGRRRRFRLYRRFDAYEQAVFVLADELVGQRVEARTAYA